MKLGDVVNVIGGGTPSKSNDGYYNGDIPWATVRDMANRTISDTELHITPKAVTESSTNIIPKHNVIIATRVGLGKVSWINQDTAINQDLKALIPKPNAAIDGHYLAIMMESLSEKIVSNGTGATVKGVTVDFIKSLQVPLPPLDIQKEIADEFSQEQAIVESNQKLIQIYDLKIQSVLTNLTTS